VVAEVITRTPLEETAVPAEAVVIPAKLEDLEMKEVILPQKETMAETLVLNGELVVAEVTHKLKIQDLLAAEELEETEHLVQLQAQEFITPVAAEVALKVVSLQAVKAEAVKVELTEQQQL
jgi:hypothetical protein